MSAFEGKSFDEPRNLTCRPRERELSLSGEQNKTNRYTTQVMPLISLQAPVALVFTQWHRDDVFYKNSIKTSATGERHLEAREVPPSVLSGRRREERRGIAADPEQGRQRDPLWQVCQAGLSASARGEVVQVKYLHPDLDNADMRSQHHFPSMELNARQSQFLCHVKLTLSTDS